MLKDIVIQPDWHTIMVSNISHLKIVRVKREKERRQWFKKRPHLRTIPDLDSEGFVGPLVEHPWYIVTQIQSLSTSYKVES